jgi:diketogulonate reductase-like aldo/keto reductase
LPHPLQLRTMRDFDRFGRRAFLELAGAGLAAGFAPGAFAQAPRMQTRVIPGTNESLPVVGLGTSDEFDALPADGGRGLQAVIATLVEHGGALIDTSPAYGSAERILGRFLGDLRLTDSMFLSTKVREYGVQNGLDSMARSEARLGKSPLDLIMVHSLRDVDTQLPSLRRWKERGRVRYIGVTTSLGRRYEKIEALIRADELDFVQLDYSVVATRAEQRLIPAAADHGVAVMVNSAFGNGGYFRRLSGRALPAWAREFGCESWAQFSLKYILGHPDVTCVIPATSDPRHMADNARAGFGTLPDAATRRRMVEYLARL